MNIEALLDQHRSAAGTDRLAGYFLVSAGMVVLTGWIVDIELLKSWFPGCPLMKAHNAVVLIMLGFTLINSLHLTRQGILNNVLLILLFINGCFGLLSPMLASSFFGEWWPGDPDSLIEDSSFIFSSSGFSFLLLSFVFLFTNQESYHWRVSGQVINGLILLIASLTCLSYLFQARVADHVDFAHGMSLPTALCFLCLSLLIALNDEEIGLGHLFSSRLIGNSLARMVFPWITGSVILLATFYIFAFRRNWFDPAQILVVLVAIFIVVSLLVTWYIVNITNELDGKRQRAGNELERLNTDLEEAIKLRTGELLLATKRLEDATKGADISIWEWTIDTNMVSGNSVFFQLFDLPENSGSINMDDLAKLVHRDDIGFLKDILHQIYKENQPIDVIHRIMKNSGDCAYVRLKGFAHRNDAGRITRIYGAHWDVTAQEKMQNDLILAQNALREANELNRQFIEQAPSAIAMFDKNMNYLAASLRWKTDYGLTGTDIIGKSHYALFPGMPKERRLLHQQSLAGAVLKNDEESYNWVDGSTRWASWEMRPWYMHDSEIGGLLIYTGDVTERREQQLVLKAKRTLKNFLRGCSGKTSYWLILRT